MSLPRPQPLTLCGQERADGGLSGTVTWTSAELLGGARRGSADPGLSVQGWLTPLGVDCGLVPGPCSRRGSSAAHRPTGACACS